MVGPNLIRFLFQGFKCEFPRRHDAFDSLSNRSSSCPGSRCHMLCRDFARGPDFWNWLVPAQLFMSMAAAIYAVASVEEIRRAVGLHKSSLLAMASVFVLVTIGVPPSLKRKTERLPFFLGLAAFLSGVAAVSIVIYPDIVPFRLSLWQAAASRPSQLFVLFGACIVTPVVVAYSLFAYWIFHGKTPEAGWE